MIKKRSSRNSGLANHEIVTLAVFMLGGDTRRIDTEDIAVKADEIAPGRFNWRKYPIIDKETVRKRLWDASKPEKGGYLFGTEKEGWILTKAGLDYAKTSLTSIKKGDLDRKPMGAKERNWLRRERERMLSSDAYQKYLAGRESEITLLEAESFFRIDSYVTGRQRLEKIIRAKTVLGDDPELGRLIPSLESIIMKREVHD